MKLTPYDHDTELRYKCPHCEFAHYKPLKEVLRPNPVIDCYCGKTVELEQLTNAKFTATPVSQVKVPVSSSVDTKSAYRLIRAQGYTMEVSDTIMKKGLTKNPQSTGELVRFALAELNDGTETN